MFGVAVLVSLGDKGLDGANPKQGSANTVWQEEMATGRGITIENQQL